MYAIRSYYVCRRIKSDPKFETVPLLFLTAKSDDASMEAGYEAGGVDYITKPFRPRITSYNVCYTKLLRVMMPEMDGFDVASALKSNAALEAIPILFLTAKEDDESIEKGFMLGSYNFV